MTKSDRVKPVIKVAQNREREAARVVAEGQRVLHERQQRLADLKKYREEYRARYLQQGGAGISAQQLRAYRNFLNKLSVAVEQQEKMVTESQAALEKTKQLWFEKHFRAKALDNVRDRYLTQEQREAARVEQKESDDRSQRAKKTEDHS